MTPQQAKEELERARKKQRDLRKEIDGLRTLLLQEGVDPDPPKIDLVPRNKMIFKKWKQGSSFACMAKTYHLSNTTISSICHRINRAITKKNVAEQYKDLIQYKDEE